MNEKCWTNIQSIHRFLQGARGNWRNSAYITCGKCPYPHLEACEDFLFVPDKDGIPALIPISDASIMAARSIEKDECLITMSRNQFINLYSEWMKMKTTGTDGCPFLEIYDLDTR